MIKYNLKNQQQQFKNVEIKKESVKLPVQSDQQASRSQHAEMYGLRKTTSVLYIAADIVHSSDRTTRTRPRPARSLPT
jgi:hypothetical protein